MPTEIKLPALKENVESVEVNAVMVKPGDSVTAGQPLLEVQADKATLDVPAPQAGRVVEVRCKAGETIKVGQVFIVLDEGGGTASGPGAKKETPAPTPPAPKPTPTPTPKATPTPAVVQTPLAAPTATLEPLVSGGDGFVRAGPATRRLARELGVDLHQVNGSERSGRITQDDIKSFVKGRISGGLSVSAPSGPVVAPPMPKFEDFGVVQREPLSKIRRLTAEQMSRAWNLIPHVTQNDDADITELEAFRKSRDGKGPKLTVTAFALKACALALKQFPNFNASIDMAANQLVLKSYYNIGVAVDTERGLLVPVIRDVNKKSVEQLAVELQEIAEKARQGKADMSGGTFTITNLGGIGGTGFTPIVNWPEVAILGMSRGKMQPVFKDGQFVPRLLLPLSLSYDHRLIDGAAAARFTRFVAELLENPWLMVVKA